MAEHSGFKLLGDIDADGHFLKNPAGIGGADGKAVRYVDNAADFIAACEDAGVDHIYVLGAALEFSSVIVITSGTRITCLGGATFDWTGDPNEYMFDNNAATGILFENAHWIKDGGVNYSAFRLSADAVCMHCEIDDLGLYWSLDVWGDRALFYHCNIKCGFGGSNGFDQTIFHTSRFDGLMRVSKGKIVRYVDCVFGGASAIYITAHSSYDVNKDLIVRGCHFDTTAYYCIYIRALDASTTQGLKFLENYFEPNDNAEPVVLLEDNADLTVDDVLFADNIFNDYNDAYLIPNGVQNRWKHRNNTYLNEAGTRYNYTGGTQNNFVYTDDGD